MSEACTNIFPLDFLPVDELKIVLSYLPFCDLLSLKLVNSLFDRKVTENDRRVRKWTVFVSSFTMQHLKIARQKPQNEMIDITFHIFDDLTSEIKNVLDEWSFQIVGLIIGHSRTIQENESHKVTTQVIDTDLSSLQSLSLYDVVGNVMLSNVGPNMKNLDFRHCSSKCIAFSLNKFAETIESVRLYLDYDIEGDVEDERQVTAECFPKLQHLWMFGSLSKLSQTLGPRLSSLHSLTALNCEENDLAESIPSLSSLKVVMMDDTTMSDLLPKVAANIEVLVVDDTADIPADIFCPKLKHLVFNYRCARPDLDFALKHKATLLSICICSKFTQTQASVFRYDFPALENVYIAGNKKKAWAARPRVIKKQEDALAFMTSILSNCHLINRNVIRFRCMNWPLPTNR